MTPRPRSRTREIAVVALVLGCVAGTPSAAAEPAASTSPPLAVAGATSADDAATRWRWPLDGFGLDRPYLAPAHRYGAGHRGIDLRALVDDAVRAPDDGIVAFAGTVVDRGVVTIDHGDGLVSTLEPVTPLVVAGQAVSRGEVVGELAAGGHATAGALHVGARLDGEYVNPLLLLGGVPRAVLLPCC